MHKARENVNGTFSIGKTWMLDDLSSIQSYNGMNPTTPEEEQHKLWAGGIGFVVTLGKPYYWQANTQKEKQFFVASLVKIYTKYTGGRTPELIGFDARERDQLLGVVSRNLPPPQTLSPSGAGAAPGSAPGAGYGQPQNRAPPRRDPSRERMQRQIPPPSQQSFTAQSSSRPLLNARREDSPSSRTSLDSDRTGSGPGPQHGQANLRRLAGSNQSQDSFARSDDSSSLPPRSRGGTSGIPSGPGRFQDRSITPTSQSATTSDNTFAGRDVSKDAPPIPAPLALPPERRRPPMPIAGDSRQRGQNLSNDNIVPAPLASPGMRREELRPPVRSNERPQTRDREMSPKLTLKSPSLPDSIPAPLPPVTVSSDIGKTERFESPTVTPKTGISQPEIISPLSAKPQDEEPPEDLRPGLGPMIKKQRSAAVSPISPVSPDTTREEDDSRPGLGPMIRKKKSKADVANTFLKAAMSANSFNTFKPRAGGAAERLRQAAATAAEKSPDGPDGITGVVPAPSLVRRLSTENNTKATTPTATLVEKNSPRNLNSVPEVKITVPESKRPTSVDGSVKTSDDSAALEKPKSKELKRPKAPSEIMQKELASINVDPAILGGRGGDLVAAWEEFGWVGEGVHTKNIDQMKEEIERELSRAQAGGWLTRLDEEDERIAAVHAGLDRCIAECDELDGLLTLNLVELSVSSGPNI